jgi:hypothetical protein
MEGGATARLAVSRARRGAADDDAPAMRMNTMSAWFATVTFIGILVFTSQAALAGPHRTREKLLRPVAASNERVRNAQASATRAVSWTGGGVSLRRSAFTSGRTIRRIRLTIVRTWLTNCVRNSARVSHVWSLSERTNTTRESAPEWAASLVSLRACNRAR